MRCARGALGPTPGRRRDVTPYRLDEEDVRQRIRFGRGRQAVPFWTKRQGTWTKGHGRPRTPRS